MKRLTALLLALALFVPAGASAAQAGVQAGSGTVTIIRNGLQPSTKGPASCFTGSVRVDPLFSQQGDARISVANVTFEPGARTAWHTHPWGQILVISAGLGRVQAEGSPMQEIRPGDVVWIPAGVRHWHGASATTAMTHMSIVVPVGGSSAQWLEKVTDEQYGGE
jgi:Uncharacterized conserved protein, contains double-stranded beta-helix domain